MSNSPAKETISCLALATNRSLHPADIGKSFSIELIIVTDRWGMLVPTDHGEVSLEKVGEGQITVVHISDGKLEHIEGQEIHRVLRTPSVLQAIRENPQIGRSWLVHCERVPMYLFALHSAIKKGTQELEACPPCWTEVADDARRQLELPPHILDDYQRHLQFLDFTGRMKIKKAKQCHNT